MKRITIEDNEEFLRQISTDVDFQKDDYKKYIQDLKDYCINHAVYALSPVQIGNPKRIIYIKNTSEDMDKNFEEGYDESIVYINPVILSQKGHTRFLESCESCIEYENGELRWLAAEIDRPYSVEIQYYDINQNIHRKTIEGFIATAFCHEYDHLNGILHMDRANEILSQTTEEKRIYRENHKYEIISKDDDFSYENIKNKYFK